MDCAQKSQPSALPRLRLRVSPTAESIVRGGHPWVYSDSIRDQNREGCSGDLAAIYDRNDRFLAVGLYDPESPIRVRVLHAGKPATLDDTWWRERLSTALSHRSPELLGPATNGYRCVNGEGDGWPGLVLDRYADHFVLKAYSAAWLPHLSRIARLLHELLRPGLLVFRVSRNIEDEASRQGFPNASVLDEAGLVITPPSDIAETPVVFEETGIRFEAEVFRGQKTGFFLDQRENRRRVGSLSAGRDVLNAFSFSGGFSLYAALGGARSVVDLDLSAHALESGRRNVALNQAVSAVDACSYEQVQGDAFAWLAEGPSRNFDLVVVDPPSLAKREVERARAIEAYGRLASSAIRRLRPGGILVSASCSAHVTDDEFFGAVRAAARANHRGFTEQGTTGPAGDHPTRIPELQYLKAIYLAFS